MERQCRQDLRFAQVQAKVLGDHGRRRRLTAQVVALPLPVNDEAGLWRKLGCCFQGLHPRSQSGQSHLKLIYLALERGQARL